MNLSENMLARRGLKGPKMFSRLRNRPETETNAVYCLSVTVLQRIDFRLLSGCLRRVESVQLVESRGASLRKGDRDYRKCFNICIEPFIALLGGRVNGNGR
jgi:hypothetical protein